MRRRASLTRGSRASARASSTRTARCSTLARRGTPRSTREFCTRPRAAAEASAIAGTPLRHGGARRAGRRWRAGNDVVALLRHLDGGRARALMDDVLARRRDRRRRGRGDALRRRCARAACRRGRDERRRGRGGRAARRAGWSAARARRRTSAADRARARVRGDSGHGASPRPGGPPRPRRSTCPRRAVRWSATR